MIRSPDGEKERQMPWKTDDSGNITVQDGKPVYVYPDGKESTLDGDAIIKSLNDVNAESKNRRLKLKEYEDKLKPVIDSGIEDIQEFIKRAKEHEKIVANYKDKDLIEAEKVEQVKRDAISGVESSWSKKYEKLQKEFETQSASLKAVVDKKDTQLKQFLIKGIFDSSPFIKNSTNLLPEFAYHTLGRNFFVEETEDGDLKVRARRLDGSDIFSLKNPSQLADAEEAISILISEHPQKDSIIIGVKDSGTGARSVQYGEKSKMQKIMAIKDPIERLKAIRASQ
jgi:hypothetical protein